jgi:antitoxin component of MazEF toxin-antitoxin module
MPRIVVISIHGTKTLNIYIIIYYNGDIMSNMFEAKVRKVGTSLGVLIPKDVVMKEKIKEDQDIKIMVLKQRKLEEVERAFGLAKGAKPFEREENDRF